MTSKFNFKGKVNVGSMGDGNTIISSISSGKRNKGNNSNTVINTGIIGNRNFKNVISSTIVDNNKLSNSIINVTGNQCVGKVNGNVNFVDLTKDDLPPPREINITHHGVSGSGSVYIEGLHPDDFDVAVKLLQKRKSNQEDPNNNNNNTAKSAKTAKTGIERFCPICDKTIIAIEYTCCDECGRNQDPAVIRFFARKLNTIPFVPAPPKLATDAELDNLKKKSIEIVEAIMDDTPDEELSDEDELCENCPGKKATVWNKEDELWLCEECYEEGEKIKAADEVVASDSE